MPKVISLKVNDVEAQMIADLGTKGLRQSDALRTGLRMLHRREFPPYAVGKDKEPDPRSKPLSLQEYVQQSGGELLTKDGSLYIRKKEGGLTVDAPVPKEYC